MQRVRRVIGIDIHRTFDEVVFWKAGKLRHGGRVDMTRTGLEGFGKSLRATDEVVVEATGNAMALSRVLSPFVARVIIANLQCSREDRLGRLRTLAGLRATGSLPEIWTRRTLPPSASVDWWPGATRSCVIAHGLRTRFTRSFTWT